MRDARTRWRGVHRLAPALAAAGLAVAGCADQGSPRASPAVVRSSPGPVATEDWQFDGQPGKLIRTRWYRLFTTERDADFVARMPLFLERALDQYTSAMGPLPRPPMRLDTFLMNGREQWAKLTRQVMGDQAATYLKIQRGGFSSGGRALLWSIGRHDTLAIAAHEGWHQYTQRTFKSELPPWLEEGIAVYMEGFTPDPSAPEQPLFSGWANTERFDQLRRAAARDDLIPLPRLLSISPQDLINTTTDGTLTYYAQVWALAHFLREGSGEKVRKELSTALADAAAGRLQASVRSRLGTKDAAPGGADLYKAYFGADLAAADKDYNAFIQKIVRPGARARIVLGLSPLDDPS